MSTIEVKTSVVADPTINNISKKIDSEITLQSLGWIYQLHINGELHYDREKLQRLLRKWHEKKYNSFLTTLLNGAEKKDTIQLARIDTIISKLKEQLQLEIDAFEREFIEENLSYFESLEGKTYLVLDGQHRIDVIAQYFDPDIKNKKGENISISFNPSTPVVYQIQGEQGKVDVKGKFKDLPERIQDYIFNSIPLLVVIYNTGDLEELTNVFITSNSMVAMSKHEKRILNYNPLNRWLVSLCNYDPIIESMFKNIGSGMTSEYDLDKKGDTLFAAEMLLWINNNNYENQSENLDEALGPNKKHKKVYVSNPEKEMTNAIFRKMANICASYDPDKYKKFSKSTLYNLFYTVAFFMQEGNSWGKSKDIDGKYKIQNEKRFAKWFFDEEYARIHAKGTYIVFKNGNKEKKQMHDYSFAKHNADQKQKSKVCMQGKGGSKYSFSDYGRLRYLLEDLYQDINKLVQIGAMKKIGSRKGIMSRGELLTAKGIPLSESTGLHQDEIKPVSEGGESTEENTQFLIGKKNQIKSNRPLPSIDNA